MARPGSTRWTVIRDAAEGNVAARAEFARLYEPVARVYLEARWRNSPYSREIDDAVQQVFLDCFRESGALSRADPDRPGGFRAFLYGIVRNVARRLEKKKRRTLEREVSGDFELDAVESRQETLSAVFDRAWVGLLLEEAARLQGERASAKGRNALRRIELLSLRFEEDLPIREIARRWHVEPAWLHHQYAQAREEFKRSLREIVRAHHGGSDADVDEECLRLLQLVL